MKVVSTRTEIKSENLFFENPSPCKMDASWLSAQKATLYGFFPGVDFAVNDAGFQIGFDRFEFAEKDVAKRMSQIQARINYLTDGHAIVHNNIPENLFARMLSAGKQRANMVFFVSTTLPDRTKRIELRCNVWNESDQQYGDETLVKAIVIDNKEEKEEANAKMELYRQMFVELY